MLGADIGNVVAGSRRSGRSGGHKDQTADQSHHCQGHAYEPGLHVPPHTLIRACKRFRVLGFGGKAEGVATVRASHLHRFLPFRDGQSHSAFRATETCHGYPLSRKGLRTVPHVQQTAPSWGILFSLPELNTLDRFVGDLTDHSSLPSSPCRPLDRRRGRSPDHGLRDGFAIVPRSVPHPEIRDMHMIPLSAR